MGASVTRTHKAQAPHSPPISIRWKEVRLRVAHVGTQPS